MPTAPRSVKVYRNDDFLAKCDDLLAKSDDLPLKSDVFSLKSGDVSLKTGGSARRDNGHEQLPFSDISCPFRALFLHGNEGSSTENEDSSVEKMMISG